MKRKLLLSIAAVLPAALMPLTAHGQIKPEKQPEVITGPVYKYRAFVGAGYTSINQVSQSRSGLLGVEASVTRDFSKYFGITAQGGHYAWTASASNALAGNPTVDMILLGPEFHAPLFDRSSLFAHGLLGAVHTGNVNISPTVSFAGGLGLGLDYSLTQRLALRLYGDNIGSSFTVTPYQSGYSPHIRWNAHAGFGVVYKF